MIYNLVHPMSWKQFYSNLYIFTDILSQFWNNYNNDCTMGLSLSQTCTGSINLLEIEREKKTSQKIRGKIFCYMPNQCDKCKLQQ